MRWPISGIGSGWKSFLYAEVPQAFRHLPASARVNIVRNHLLTQDRMRLMAISPDETMVLVAAGRLLLGGLFILGGIGHLFALPTVAGQMAARGVPLPMLALIAGTAFQIVAGVSLMLGLFVPMAALGLILFTIAGSVMLMNFWDMTGEKRTRAIDNWQSNLGVIGGLLIVCALALGTPYKTDPTVASSRQSSRDQTVERLRFGISLP